MITHEWRSALDEVEAEQVAEMLSVASAFDAEPGFTIVRPDSVRPGARPSANEPTQLVVRRRPDDHRARPDASAWPVVAFLRLGAEDHGTQLSLVVAPAYRSLGIATSLFEQVRFGPRGEDDPHPLRAWAQGNHPATVRLAQRFGAARERRVLRLVRELEPAFEEPGGPLVVEVVADGEGLRLAAQLEERVGSGAGVVVPSHTVPADDGPGAVVIAAHNRRGERLGVARLRGVDQDDRSGSQAATIETLVIDPAADRWVTTRALIDGIARDLRRRGLGGVVVHLDDDRESSLATLRRHGFQHDRSDVRYRLR